MRLGFIRPLYDHPGPYASVYAADSGATTVSSLAGAGPATRQAIERELSAAAGPRALFAAHGTVVLSEGLPQGPTLLRWSPLPHVTPMLAARGENVPHLRVIADRTGAELTVVGSGSPRHPVAGSAPWPLRSTARGGWSRRVEEPAEEAWARAAAMIDEQVRGIGAELVVMAGEPRPRSAVMSRLNTRSADRVLMVEHGGRTDRGRFARDAERVLDGWLERRRTELLGRCLDGSGATGLGRVARVLREGRAHAVLLPGELSQAMWIGRGGAQLALSADELRRRGVQEPVRERADAALARAAAMTDAELWFCPELTEAAAVVRY